MASQALNRQHIARNFGGAATRYDAHAQLQRQLSQTLRGQWPVLAAGSRVFDLGCGTGFDSLWLQNQTLEVHAVDVAEGMLNAAQQRCGGKLNTHQSSINQLASLNIAADAAWSNCMLQWVENMPQAMQQVHASLAPQSVFLGCLFTQGSLQELKTAWATVDSHPHVVQLPEAEAVERALLSAGFTIGWQKNLSTVLHFDNLTAIRDHLRGLGATNANKNRTKGLTSKTALAQLTRALNSQREDAGIPLTWNAWLFKAVKT